MEQTLQECSNNMLLQLTIGVILVVVNLVLAAGGGMIFFMLRRLIDSNDELPEQFAKIHRRISDIDKAQGRHSVRLDNLERSGP